MFCYNCGNDCEDAKFCSVCGTKLVMAVQNQTDKPVATTVKKSKNTNQGATTIPTSGGYLGTAGSLVLSDTGLFVSKQSLFKKTRTTIAYDQLTKVIYSRPSYKLGAQGALLFRGGVNQNEPIPDRKILHTDIAAIAFSPEKDCLFYHIFRMLKTVAPAGTHFEMIVPEKNVPGLDAMSQSVDIEYFFDMYAPHRERAASGICAKHGLSPMAAKNLVDTVFDARQNELYALDPLDALRDLNLVVDSMRRAERGRNQADAERRKRREQEEVKNILDRMETRQILKDFRD